MRLHALHVQGLRHPGGVERVAFDPGYGLVVPRTEDDAAALRAALGALLYPSSELAGLTRWLEGSAADAPAARVGLAFSLQSESLRMIADVRSGRVHLGRFDSDTERYERLATDPIEIERLLAERGRPGCDELFGARSLGWDAPVVTPRPLDTRERERLEDELAQAEARRAELEELETRASHLRAARERFVTLERRKGPPEPGPGEERFLELGDKLDGLEERVEDFRTLLDSRERERGGIAEARQSLIDDRARLRTVPAQQRPWIWLGVALTLAGLTAAELVDAWLGAFALAGTGIALTALSLSTGARRKLGAVETSLAALRVRERTIERDFESKGAEVRSLLVGLGLEGPDELLEQAARLRELQGSVELGERQIEAARQEYPEEAELELGELEERISALRASSTPGELLARLAELEAWEPEPDARAPDFSLEKLAERSGRSVEALAGRVESVVTPYLRNLTGGFLCEARWDPLEGWRLRDENGTESDLAGLPPVVAVAMRCAYVEAFAAYDPEPLFVGTKLPELDASARDGLGRALRRLGGVVQVIQVASEREPWSERASAVVELG